MVALAQTGTGKTAAFSSYPKLMPTTHTSINFISNTRIVFADYQRKNYSKYEKGINVVAVYGGASITEQARDIKRGAQIIVATQEECKI
jgi:ATP-dependent RNA helicase DeaD